MCRNQVAPVHKFEELDEGTLYTICMKVQSASPHCAGDKNTKRCSIRKEICKTAETHCSPIPPAKQGRAKQADCGEAFNPFKQIR